jgi:hypothetical membrane protein
MLRRAFLQHTRWLGVAGPVVLVTGAVLAARAYPAVDGYGYSFLNRAISALGDPRHSTGALYFNLGLMTGATMMALFTLGVGMRVQTRRSRRITTVGVVGAINMALVGVFPDTPPVQVLHLIVAGTAFVCTVWLGMGFTIDMLLSPQEVLPRWLIVPGALAATCSGSFLFTIIATRAGLLPRDWTRFGEAGSRPFLDLVFMFEWSVLFSILLWCFCTALSFREPAPAAPQPPAG